MNNSDQSSPVKLWYRHTDVEDRCEWFLQMLVQF